MKVEKQELPFHLIMITLETELELKNLLRVIREAMQRCYPHTDGFLDSLCIELGGFVR